jgi:hypothetical protein
MMPDDFEMALKVAVIGGVFILAPLIRYLIWKKRTSTAVRALVYRLYSPWGISAFYGILVVACSIVLVVGIHTQLDFLVHVIPLTLLLAVGFGFSRMWSPHPIHLLEEAPSGALVGLHAVRQLRREGVQMSTCVGMALRRTLVSEVIDAFLRARSREIDVSLLELEAHHLAGGNPMAIVGAMERLRDEGASTSFADLAALEFQGYSIERSVKEFIGDR